MNNINEEKTETIDFKKKKNLYKKLGALKFQKVVFVVEKLKFKVIDKICPNIYVLFNKQCDKKVKKLCSKNISEEEKNNIIFEYNCRKMMFKKELIEKKNVNYHFNDNNATKFYKYLNWNKKVHQKNMISDIIFMIISIIGIFLLQNTLFTLSCLFLIYNLLALVIDFECVNLQNYNICRFEEKKHILEQLECRSKEKDLQNYCDVSKTVYEELKNSIELPKSENIVSKLTTKEQITQLRNLAIEIKSQRENYKIKEKEKRL